MGKLPNFRGCEDVKLIGHGEWSDPELLWEHEGNEYLFNYWDIESALWDNFTEITGINDEDRNDTTEEKFDKYVQDNCVDYLKEVIAGGYFAEGSTDWKDNN